MKYHRPVLLQKTIEFLDPARGKLFIDATVGGGGHAFELLKRGGKVLGIDRDPEAIKHIKKSQKLKAKSQKLVLVCGNFSQIGEIAKSEGFSQLSGILFDLGVSSHQLEEARRGFSFIHEGPLDMRMDPNLNVRAFDLVNNFDKRRLNEIFKTYSQEELSWPIADAICRARQVKTIETTTELAKIVEAVYARHIKRKNKRIHPATKTFLALRLVVNSELLNLEDSLPQTVDLLEIGGRLVIVSYHSLEDGIVKRFFKQESRLKILTPKPIGPENSEIEANPRARSAKLRVAERI
ncbi:MAG: Ribosomal RNA small subunit methyltransferase H [Candidatus Curtissbacteria bacterium GW2011_GWC2_38_9]|uniref:Ribosomal RNA small subunit methyltransferase H n=3 Tax=Candidatus Curtissiibacteriota TaxID=1752717 RepID=A0A1F5HQQ2_9BACT|nr:MAG: Ribosomal RNA small subunit methyltransferase H [Candidatus Curtissbacteria bacterium GW2011_GWC2_38_9]KKS03534.1 MAG: Ribosomal RNA small subunit methyltransferase H [Candidatus Curtissbacteria bacterium GW2011_GWA2_41_24]OGE06452.1 MAG: 16S rRNA (cytosine(1402)-N(4))-methyltransferase [Candidatus Curtissbacteria bacterium RIFCSPLOWO2_02_41_11]